MKLSKTKVYGVRLKDRDALAASSSGGAFTAFSDVFLSDGNAVVCSTYNYKTHQQEFQLITTKDERNSARGSKYVQSVMGDIFKKAEQWLERHSDRKMLFVGMGCQAAGFKAYAEAKGFFNRVTVIDIICHGSSSPQLWTEYAAEIEKNGKIESLSFRDKRNGWKRPTSIAIVNREEVPLNSYMRIFYNRKALRLSCHKCPYSSTDRNVDITIGDFWHIDERIPDKYDELGTSLILVYTDNGLNLMEQIKDSVDWFESNTKDCIQDNLERPTKVAEGREKFWTDYYNHGINYISKKYGTDKLIDKVKRKIKKII